MSDLPITKMCIRSGLFKLIIWDRWVDGGGHSLNICSIVQNDTFARQVSRIRFPRLSGIMADIKSLFCSSNNYGISVHDPSSAFPMGNGTCSFKRELVIIPVIVYGQTG